MLQGLLRGEGTEVGRLHVATLMKKMGIEAIYRRPNTSKPAPVTKSILISCASWRSPGPTSLGNGHNVCADGAGFVHLCAVVDWFSRRFCPAAVDHDGGGLHRSGRDALARYGKPEIFNTDQGSQFTSIDFTAVLKKAEIAISMDGKGAWRDNVRRAALAVDQIRRGLSPRLQDRIRGSRWHRPLSRLLHSRRPHSSFDRQTPDQAYFNALAPMMVAA